MHITNTSKKTQKTLGESNMTDKVMIDGVNVSGCLNFDKSDKIHCCDFPYDKCEGVPNCLYKQLQRKEQECEELKKKNEELTILSMDLNIAHKTILKQFNITDKSRDMWREIAEHYKQALEKIEKTVVVISLMENWSGTEEILNIISGVKECNKD